MFITYLIGSLGALFAYFWVPSKYMFAWSFDRVIPSKFADVSQRFHTPYLSVIAIVVIGVILSFLYSILGYSTLFTMGSLVWGVSYIVPGLALAVFPYVKKDLFSQAPGWVAKKVAGIPVVSIVGLLTVIGFGYVGYVGYSNAAFAVPNTFGYELYASLIIVGFVIYFASKAYHKSRGLDISQALKEIPPE
jgi:amino acid transporter